MTGDTQRVTCTNALYVANSAAVTRLDDTKFDLTDQRASASGRAGPAGSPWFSLPRRGNARCALPMARRPPSSPATASCRSRHAELGRGRRRQRDRPGAARAICRTHRRPQAQVLGVMTGEGFAAIAQEDRADQRQRRDVARHRLDGADGPCSRPIWATQRPGNNQNSLWWGDANGLVKSPARAASGRRAVVLQLLDSRVNEAGDVGRDRARHQRQRRRQVRERARWCGAGRAAW